MNGSPDFDWKFYRIGGLDQVTLRTADELRHLDELDPKLWVVLSMPANSVQFDGRTLELLDVNHDGRIRVPEVREAVRWTVAHLKDPATMVEGADLLPLACIRDDTDEGRQILASARRMLAHLGKPDAPALSQEDTAEALRNVSRQLFNGDGIIPEHDSLDEAMKGFLRDIMQTVGNVQDAGGQPGVSQELADRFLEEAGTFLNWWGAREEARNTWPLGDASEAGYDLMRELAAKIEDYFLRCDLAGYDPRAADKVNAPEAVLEQLGTGRIDPDSSALAALPLAHAAPARPLPLRDGVNPAWIVRLGALRDSVIVPLLGGRDSLSREDWKKLREAFAPYDALMASRPASPVGSLGEERLRELTDGDLPRRFAELARQDRAAAPEVAAMNSVERLVLFHRHLHRLLMNFVSFTDFYAPEKSTPFELGTLYIDGRSTRLCLKVEDIEEHASRSPLSYLCLVYCTCVRKESPAALNIVAAVTAGTQDRLTPGRHGVFVDSQGTTWDATLVRLVDNPISIRTAMTAPYRRVARMITEQIEKFSASKDSAITAGSAQAVQKLISAPAGGDAARAPDAPFDIGKSVGIFAAIGLALGALGTALASIAASLMSLHWWQFPLLVLGILILISAPSMMLAWLKLRRRTLGPVLDASGWAVNSRIPINFMLGRVLTDTAELPGNAERSLNDPFRKPGFWKWWMTALLTLCFVAGLGIGGWWAWRSHQEDRRAETVVEEMVERAAGEAVSAVAGSGAEEETSDPR